MFKLVRLVALLSIGSSLVTATSSSSHGPVAIHTGKPAGKEVKYNDRTCVLILNCCTT